MPTARWTPLSIQGRAAPDFPLFTRWPCNPMARFWWEGTLILWADRPVTTWADSILIARWTVHSLRMRAMSSMRWHCRQTKKFWLEECSQDWAGKTVTASGDSILMAAWIAALIREQ